MLFYPVITLPQSGILMWATACDLYRQSEEGGKKYRKSQGSCRCTEGCTVTVLSNSQLLCRCRQMLVVKSSNLYSLKIPGQLYNELEYDRNTNAMQSTQFLESSENVDINLEESDDGTQHSGVEDLLPTSLPSCYQGQGRRKAAIVFDNCMEWY